MLWVQFYEYLCWIDLRRSSCQRHIRESECSLASSYIMPYFHIHQGGANLDFLPQHAIKYLGDAGLHCTGDAMKSNRACATC